MKVLLHDLTKEEIENNIRSSKEELVVLTEKEKVPRYCMGCFGCWIKNPGECVIKDGYQNMGKYIGNCEELIIICKSVYGEFSPYVKTLVDRSISVCHPYFTKREGMMHHKLRYNNPFKVTVYCYSTDITAEEKKTFINRCKAMAINFGANVSGVHFVNGKEGLGGVAI